MISLQDAVEGLYQIAIVEGKRQSPNRLARLADMCVEQLAERGVTGADRELPVPRYRAIQELGRGVAQRWSGTARNQPEIDPAQYRWDGPESSR